MNQVAAAASVTPPQEAVPILMYHEVAEASEVEALSRKTQRNYVLTSAQFELHMAALAEAGVNAVTLDQICGWQAGHVPLPQRPVAITFDDGFAGNLTHALPILRNYGFNATVFIVTDWIGSPFMMNWDQLAALSRAGVSVQSHTATHPLLSTLDNAQTESELVTSRAALESALGIKVRHVALPHGDYNSHYELAARRSGYESGCTSIFGVNERATRAFFLRRIAITDSVSAGTLHGLVTVDQKLYARMASRARLKRSVSRLLGKRLYSRLVNYVYGVQQQPGDGPLA